MTTVIVGAGRIGSSVIELADSEEIDLTVIEREHKRANELEPNGNCRIIHDDATERDTLHKAQVGDADAIITTTEQDTTNLMVLMLARELGCETLVSVVHDEENIPLFRQLGATIIENPQRLIAEYLFRGTHDPGIQGFMHVGDREGGAEVFEISVAADAPIIGKTLEEADVEGFLPPSMVVVAVERDGEIIIPRGNTRVEVDDLVTVFSKEGITNEVIEPFKPESERYRDAGEE